jgi:hypothetical protein
VSALGLLLLSSFATAQTTKTNLYQKPPPSALVAVSEETGALAAAGSDIKGKNAAKAPIKNITPAHAARGNLPGEYQTTLSAGFRANESPVVLPSSPHKATVGRLPVGAVIDAEILESVIAFSDLKTPVRALIRSGELKGAVLVGEASLERNSKRVTIEFKRFRLNNSTEVYTTLASALDLEGILGLEGEHHTGEAKYFAGELLAAAAAGFADASVERSTTAFGQIQDQPSLDTSGKKALASAMNRTADRFAEKTRTAPEYSILRGPAGIKILIQDQPRLTE